ncbi:hypothetical protein [Jeotgalibacillus salarius]|uniref:Uncharacterized protein n=1 Tax=Jeotgalibacillus salarius TaxID=546023 RepID=A0A4Y8LGZ7_9BACL|nr:hypothetical protein [Jeotgalibacillus salarius]TFE01984.1 hypothetical protein E2626_05255 [Jeotgalibacillus salarius]
MIKLLNTLNGFLRNGLNASCVFLMVVFNQYERPIEVLASLTHSAYDRVLFFGEEMPPLILTVKDNE